ncbi:histidine kinase [Fibrisoma limi BUZ 3]|uniref:histidine kinase n=1 Tax=Fibrisoma limi BUZ 3 TaxID=1185876 RepID=I2GFY7_9BACT|nr:sensor histidine kinase [Fibrisoma limi]CCH52812.1 histidine kinase [Fibrisoma limi BUZ 3]
MSDGFSNNNKNHQVIPVRFTRLYVTILVTLAVLLTIGQGVTQWRLNTVQDKIWITRYAALQRHQSQQIVKQALQIEDPNEQANFAANVAELHQVFATFERYHLEGREGRVSDQNVTIELPDRIREMYLAIRPEFEAIQSSARRMMRLQRFEEASQPDVQASLQLMLANEKPFLEEMDAIVREYNAQVRNELSSMQTIEAYLYLFTVLVLVGIGLLIIRPAARKLRQTLAQLIAAEARTTAANKKLISVNKSLKETRQKLFEATKQQYQQEINEQKVRTSYLVAGQEEERKRLSRELHDGLGQMLTAIKLQIEGLEAGLARNAAQPAANGTVPYAKNLSTLKNLITQTIQETRTISNNLMPTVLSDFGVIPALKMLAENDRSEAIDVTFETNLTPDMPRLNKDLEIMLYRVTQEAVSNAVRHAQPSHVHIGLFEKDSYLHLIVTDDGRGFKPGSKLQRQKEAEELNSVRSQTIASHESNRRVSQGLHNMQERAKLLNGKFKISSVPGKGTKVQVSIPYNTQPIHHDTY